MNQLSLAAQRLVPFEYFLPTARVTPKDLPSNEQLIECFKRAIFEAMQAAGVAEANVDYSGGGDEGALDEVRFYNSQAQQFEPKVLPQVSLPAVMLEADNRWRWVPRCVSLKAALEEFLWGAVDLHHRGWENNEGGRGCLTFSAADGEQAETVELQHADYYVEEAWSSVEL